ncbi:MAG: hypothetical protein ACJKTH_01550 [Patescibacteria group bacterium UBA2163]
MTKKKETTRTARGAKKKADTIKKRQDAQKKQLIELLEKSPNVGYALSRVGINRSTWSRWRHEDIQFRIDSNYALEFGVASTADLVEGSMLDNAQKGSVPAQKFYLIHNHERYRPAQNIPEENPLTEERKKEIGDALKAWEAQDPEDEWVEIDDEDDV